VLQRANERSILQATKMGNNNWMAFILHRNCLLKHVIEGRIEEMGRRRRRRRIGGGGDASSYWMILRKRKDTVN